MSDKPDPDSLAESIISQVEELREAAAAKPGRASEAGEPMNFRVKPEFAQRFRMYAVEHRMRLSAVLVRAFEALEREESAQ